MKTITPLIVDNHIEKMNTHFLAIKVLTKIFIVFIQKLEHFKIIDFKNKSYIVYAPDITFTLLNIA